MKGYSEKSYTLKVSRDELLDIRYALYKIKGEQAFTYEERFAHLEQQVTELLEDDD